jgi:class 3 adenylate cyclase
VCRLARKIATYRVGDLAAYRDIVRAVVKTIGDALMATRERPMGTDLPMRDAMAKLRDDLLFKIGIHKGVGMLKEQRIILGKPQILRRACKA